MSACAAPLRGERGWTTRFEEEAVLRWFTDRRLFLKSLKRRFFDLWVGRFSSVSTDPGFYDQVVSQRDRMAVRKTS